MSPIETLLCSAIVSLAGAIVWMYKAQDKSRKADREEQEKSRQLYRGLMEQRIDDLQTRVTLMDKHVLECNEDRIRLSTRLATLEERERIRCSKEDCPLGKYPVEIRDKKSETGGK